mmetsp:Transcript_28333/g.39393  ORF Transcript_28333/g.39393 Transcript_28333/m.39393 type:complete len:668 (+) Transcript_28333:828-2831(+)
MKEKFFKKNRSIIMRIMQQKRLADAQAEERGRRSPGAGERPAYVDFEISVQSAPQSAPRFNRQRSLSDPSLRGIVNQISRTPPPRQVAPKRMDSSNFSRGPAPTPGEQDLRRAGIINTQERPNQLTRLQEINRRYNEEQAEYQAAQAKRAYQARQEAPPQLPPSPGYQGPSRGYQGQQQQRFQPQANPGYGQPPSRVQPQANRGYYDQRSPPQLPPPQLPPPQLPPQQQFSSPQQLPPQQLPPKRQYYNEQQQAPPQLPPNRGQYGGQQPLQANRGYYAAQQDPTSLPPGRGYAPQEEAPPQLPKREYYSPQPGRPQLQAKLGYSEQQRSPPPQLPTRRDTAASLGSANSAGEYVRKSKEKPKIPPPPMLLQDKLKRSMQDIRSAISPEDDEQSRSKAASVVSEKEKDFLGSFIDGVVRESSLSKITAETKSSAPTRRAPEPRKEEPKSNFANQLAMAIKKRNKSPKNSPLVRSIPRKSPVSSKQPSKMTQPSASPSWNNIRREKLQEATPDNDDDWEDEQPAPKMKPARMQQPPRKPTPRNWQEVKKAEQHKENSISMSVDNEEPREDTVSILMKQKYTFDTTPLGFTLEEVGKNGMPFTTKFAFCVVPDSNFDIMEDYGINKGDGILSINGVDISKPGTPLKDALREIRKGVRNLPIDIVFALCE